MRIDGDDVKFRSGRVEFANGGVVGISSDGELSGGYDEGFGHDNDVPLSKNEREELAAYMIELWVKFAEKEII